MSDFLPAYLIVGDNSSVLAHEVTVLLKSLSADEDTEVFALTSSDDIASRLGATSLFAQRQVFTLREKISTEQQKALIEYLESAELDNCVLIVAPKASAALKKAVLDAGGAFIEATGRSYKDTAARLLAGSGVALPASVKALISETVGQEVERIPSILATLTEVYAGQTSRLSADQVLPYLGAKGSVPPWDLTDAIDAGDASRALRVLDRLLSDQSPFALYSLVNNHIERMFRLGESGMRTEVEAAAFLGLKGSTYPAKKALGTLRRYGSCLPDLVALGVKAGNDLRGGTGVPRRTTLEVYVARLCTYPRR